MPDYQLSKIYKLHCILENDDEPLVYYGSTTEPYLSRRLAGHIRKYKCYLNNKEDFITSFKLFEKYGLDNLDVILIEEIEKKLLKDKLFNYIKNDNSSLNKKYS
jgi:hypothetical protein